MLEVHDEVAFDELRKVEQLVHLVALHEGARGARGPARTLTPEKLRLRHDHEAARLAVGHERIEARSVAEDHAESLVERAAQELRAQFLPRRRLL